MFHCENLSIKSDKNRAEQVWMNYPVHVQRIDRAQGDFFGTVHTNTQINFLKCLFHNHLSHMRKQKVKIPRKDSLTTFATLVENLLLSHKQLCECFLLWTGDDEPCSIRTGRFEVICGQHFTMNHSVYNLVCNLSQPKFNQTDKLTWSFAKLSSCLS